MALFTNKADRTLPLITRLYQVEAHEYRELVLQLWETSSIFAPEPEYREGLLSALESPDVVDKLTYELRLLRLAMDGAADNLLPGAVWRYGDGEAIINDALERHLGPPQLDWVRGVRPGRTQHMNGITPEGRQQAYPSVSFGDPLDYRNDPLLKQIPARAWAQFLAAVERAEFKRCSECKNPFAVMSKKRVYCSQRCASRAGERRRYEERFREYKVIRGQGAITFSSDTIS